MKLNKGKWLGESTSRQEGLPKLSAESSDEPGFIEDHVVESVDVWPTAFEYSSPNIRSEVFDQKFPLIRHRFSEYLQ